jgi:hypothetical protein
VLVSLLYVPDFPILCVIFFLHSLCDFLWNLFLRIFVRFLSLLTTTTFPLEDLNDEDNINKVIDPDFRVLLM